VVDILTSLLKDAKTLAEGAITLVAIIFVITTWVRTRSLVPTLGAVMLGAVVIFGVQHFDFLEQKVQQDVEQRDTP
jgi:hypothetical protein